MSSNTPSSDAIAISRSTIRQIGVVGGIVIVLVVIAFVIVLLVQSVSTKDPLASAINSSEFQGVFLTNGQVYFGKLSAPGGDFYYLRDIYYLSAQASPQAGKPTRQRLIKLGSEIHGPEDLMVINRNQILFVENLKPTGQVSRAILQSSGHP